MADDRTCLTRSALAPAQEGRTMAGVAGRNCLSYHRSSGRQDCARGAVARQPRRQRAAQRAPRCASRPISTRSILRRAQRCGDVLETEDVSGKGFRTIRRSPLDPYRRTHFPRKDAQTISRLRDMNQTDRITRWLYWTNHLPVRSSGILLHSSDVCGI
jgi:hypothetical protein